MFIPYLSNYPFDKNVAKYAIINLFVLSICIKTNYIYLTVRETLKIIVTTKLLNMIVNALVLVSFKRKLCLFYFVVLIFKY